METGDTPEPVAIPVVYVIVGGLDSYDHAKWIAGIFTSKKLLLEKINAEPDMKAWVNEQGDIEISGTYWFDVTEKKLDSWE